VSTPRRQMMGISSPGDLGPGIGRVLAGITEAAIMLCLRSARRYSKSSRGHSIAVSYQGRQRRMGFNESAVNAFVARELKSSILDLTR
jgi:hypothetical protein